MPGKEKRRRALRLAAGSLAAAALLAGAYLLYVKTGIGFVCPFRLLTSLQCPGCGSTHAIGALLRLDWRAALTHNLLFPVEAAYLVWVCAFCAREYLLNGRFRYQSPCKALDITVLVLVLAWFIIRNLIPY